MTSEERNGLRQLVSEARKGRVEKFRRVEDELDRMADPNHVVSGQPEGERRLFTNPKTMLPWG